MTSVLTKRGQREAQQRLIEAIWPFAVGALVFAVLRFTLASITPAATALAGILAALLWASIDVRYDPASAPAPAPKQIRLAEVLFGGAVLFSAFAFPGGWTLAVFVSAALGVLVPMAGTLVLGRRYERWQPAATRLGLLRDAFSRIPLKTRALGVLGAASLSGFLAAAGVTGLAVPLGLLVVLALTRPHWAAAKRDAQTRVAVEAALAGVMSGGAWTPLLQSFGRIPMQRLDLDRDGAPASLVLPLPEKAGKESQAKVSDEIADRLSGWGDFAITWDTGAGRRITVQHVEPLPTALDYDGRPATGQDGRKVWLGQGKVNREMVETQPDLVVGDTVDVYHDFATVAHLMVVGVPGAGKSISMQNVIAQWLHAGNLVIVLDPKKVGFTRLIGKKGVLTVADDPVTMAAALRGARDEMNARYTQMKRLRLDNVMDFPEAERPPLLLVVIDEATEAVAIEKVARDDEAGQAVNQAKYEIAADLSSIARLGRAAGVHLLIGAQRPDASDIGGNTRSQFEGRLMMGPADSTARQMAGFGNSNIQATPGIKGRGLNGRVNTAPIELQTVYTPISVFDDLPDAHQPPPVDANRDGVVIVVEEFLAAESEAGRIGVLRAALAAGRLTDDDADACGYSDTADVARVISEHDQRLAEWQRDAADELAVERISRRRDTRGQVDEGQGTPTIPGSTSNTADASTGGGDERKRHNGRRVEPLPTGEARVALDRLVGLAANKAQIRQLEAKVKMDQLRAERGIGGGQVSAPNLIFIGPPGTGKTEVARIVGSLLRDLEVLSSGHLIDTTPASIKGAYVGHSGQMADTACDDARDGLLFVDEGYGLSRDEFGREALEQVMVRAENDRNLCVILAGYPDEMDNLLDLNPGLRSRFPTRVEFGNYSVDELVRIGEVIAERLGFEFAPDASAAFRALVETQDQDGREWANARSVRNLVQAAVERLDLRLHEADAETLTTMDLVTLRAADVYPGHEGKSLTLSGVGRCPGLPTQPPNARPSGDSAPGDIASSGGAASPEEWLNQFTA